jgi:hypothetical protein
MIFKDPFHYRLTNKPSIALSRGKTCLSGAQQPSESPPYPENIQDTDDPDHQCDDPDFMHPGIPGRGNVSERLAFLFA